MEWWQVILGMLGSSVLTALVKGWFDKKAADRARKNELEDRAMEKDEQKQSLEDQFIKFRQEQKKENAELRQRLAGVESTMHTVSKNTKAMLFSDIYREMMEYIRAGHISPQDRLRIKKRVGEYEGDYGKNTDLSNALDEVDNLRNLT